MASTSTRTKERTAIPKQAVKKPRLYKVLMHNDHYTTMEFVVMILQSVFRAPAEDAIRIMLNVHRAGVGLCGVYPADIAETKVAIVHERAKINGFPLRCSIEPE